MPRIATWKQTERRNVADVLDYALSGTVRKWKHAETGDTVAVEAFHESEGMDGRFYRISHNGEPVTARDTLTAATAAVRDTLRANTDGLDEDGE